MKKLSLLLLIVMLIGSVVTGCGGSNDAGEKTVKIGGKAGTEAYVLANLAKVLLEEEGFKVKTKLGVKSVLARKALETGEVDLYYEYTGTAYTVYHKASNKEVMTNPEKVYEWVKKKDKEQNLLWLDRITYNNTYTVMLREEDAKQWNIQSLSDLAAKAKELGLTFGTDSEFYQRPDGLQALMKSYNLEFGDIKKMSAGIVYKALKEGKIDAGMGYSTDGRIKAFGFVNLKDDQNFFPVYNPAPVIRKEVLEEYPEIEKILKPLTKKLTTAEVQKLNAKVAIEHQEAYQVAKEWLKKQGLI
ncbi:ABC transporter substrate-binding protein [Halanaerobacter jeridensis]|uniref:Osmoprotectant transport system substrate-binding protein n=1 Tax=Halanaerobacter jeridensis TaxID=706427 RepID=A0A938XQA1_9FIRM|nr:glycine betaine ABC transporter substrate-binding protein [Halanaerobacter jeridensis]MBM7557412.1 osmoprotectant transport system substrate-binding protein [Halanaerobacter jeridensis]